MAPIPSSRATNAATTDESCAPTGLLVLWLGRALAALRWLRDKAWRGLRQLRSRSVQKTGPPRSEAQSQGERVGTALGEREQQLGDLIESGEARVLGLPDVVAVIDLL